MSLEVVHIQIVRERQEEKFHACSFCHESFTSSGALDRHVGLSHPSLHIQEVFVCPLCQCCVLCRPDLLDHLTTHHQIQTHKMEESTLCEFCGLKHQSKERLNDHINQQHHVNVNHRKINFLGLVELTMQDLFSMGMGQPSSKTLFKVTEIALMESSKSDPFTKQVIKMDTKVYSDPTVVCHMESAPVQVNSMLSDKQNDHNKENAGKGVEKGMTVWNNNLTNPQQLTNPLSEGTPAKKKTFNEHVQSEVAATERYKSEETEKYSTSEDQAVNTNEDKRIEECKMNGSKDEQLSEGGNSSREIITVREMEDESDSQMEMIISCEEEGEEERTGGCHVSLGPGEIVLAVESEQELVWDREVMSQVISSSGILRQQDIVHTHSNQVEVCQVLPSKADSQEESKQSATSHSVCSQGGVMQEVDDDGLRTLKINQVSNKVTVQCVEQDRLSGQPSHNNQEQSNQQRLRYFNKCNLTVSGGGLSVDKKQLDPHAHTTRSTNNASSAPATDSTGPRKVESVKSEAVSNEGARKLQRKKECSICGQVFGHVAELEQHRSSQHGVRIKCDLCEDTFIYSKSLRSHYQRKHTTAAPFQCEACDKTFKCRSNLWSHRLTHLSPAARKYQCPECSQRFPTRPKLTTHLQTHTGQKKFQCGECNKGFVYQGLLMRHLQKHITDARSTFMGDDNSVFIVEMEQVKLPAR